MIFRKTEAKSSTVSLEGCKALRLLDDFDFSRSEIRRVRSVAATQDGRLVCPSGKTPCPHRIPAATK
jgi:hypothetical protein